MPTATKLETKRRDIHVSNRSKRILEPTVTPLTPPHSKVVLRSLGEIMAQLGNKETGSVDDRDFVVARERHELSVLRQGRNVTPTLPEQG